MYGFFLNVRILSKKNVRIVRIFFQKLYGLYGFFSKIVRIVRISSKMYGFFQKSFGHPESVKITF